MPRVSKRPASARAPTLGHKTEGPGIDSLPSFPSDRLTWDAWKTQQAFIVPYYFTPLFWPLPHRRRSMSWPWVISPRQMEPVLSESDHRREDQQERHQSTTDRQTDTWTD